MKSIVLWGGVGLALVVGLIAVFTFINPQQDTVVSANLSVPIHEADHIKGNIVSSVVLVEYGDFQCPACRAYMPIVQRVEEELGDRIAIVFRHFPLRSIHPNAEISARAAEAAAMQGKFWEMHDILFERQDEWARSSEARNIFEEYAAQLGLDTEQFRKDLDSSEVADQVQEDLNAALQDGLQGTPSFFLGGKRLSNPQSYDAFQQAILDELGEAQSSPEPEDS
jgi:formate-nitrite transporter family protein